MSYICQACGVSANDATNLCHPTDEALNSKFCGAPAVEVCKKKTTLMKYSCDACGSVSAKPENLCIPHEIR